MTAIMFMGTGSDVGKSLIVAGLCRHFANQGLRVAPFKPQNMSNNAAVADGGEIGRAQALQARAAKIAPNVHMNPILLKPEGETGAQVIVQGKRHGAMGARDFFANRAQFMPAILESFALLKSQNDLVLVEGAGSPAEINLRDGDLANMGFARATTIPALLIGDIHRGGVIASLVGTWNILPPEDRALLKGFIVNKFYGDPALFTDGMKFVETETGAPCLGIVPHFAGAAKLPAEDSMALESKSHKLGGLKICVLRLPRIANFDDIDPLRLEPGVDVIFVNEGEAIPGDAALVIIPGSKSTISDFLSLKRNCWDIDLAAHRRRGGKILGLCGGYQMLGTAIHDPQGIEGKPQSCAALGFLDVETTMLSDKRVTQTKATHCATGCELDAYEIHIGTTAGPDTKRPFAQTPFGPDGATSGDGLVSGTYLHGSFTSDAFRKAYLAGLGIESALAYDITVEAALESLAAHLAQHLDTQKILDLAR